MYVKAARPGRPLLHLAELETPLHEVAMTVEASWVRGARDYGIGLVCRYENAANYYLISLLSGGRYNIVRYRDGKPTSVTGGIRTSGRISADANVIDARCVGDDPTSLKLTVNGRTVGTATDADGINGGTVGIRVGSSEAWVTCRFDDVALRYL